MVLTQAQIDATNQGSIDAANKANVATGVVTPNKTAGGASVPNSSFTPPPPTPVAPTNVTPAQAGTTVQTSSGPTTVGVPLTTAQLQQQGGTYTGANGQQYYTYDSTPVNGSSGSITPTPIPSTGNPDVDALAKDQAQQAADATTFSNLVTGISNGSVPLSAGDEAQIQGLQQQFETLINQQNLLNKGATGLASTRGYQSGAAEYSPAFQANIINSVASAGATKIASLQTQEASAVSALTESLQNNDINAAKTAYDALNDAHTATQNALKTAISDTQGAINDAHIANVLASGVTDPTQILETLQAQGYTDISSSDIASAIKNLSPDAANIYDIQKTAAANGANATTLAAIGAAPNTTAALVAAGTFLQTNSIPDVQKTAAANGAPASVIQAIGQATNLTDALTAAGSYAQTLTGDLAQYQEYSKQATASGQVPEDYETWENAQAYNKAYSTAAGSAAGQASGAGTEGGPTSPITSPLGITYNAPADIAPYVGFATNGVKYVDMSNFAGTPTEKNAAIADAQAAGYKIITNKNTALDMQNISNATANLQSMQDAFDANAPDSAAARDTYAAQLNKLNAFLQTNPSDAAIGTFTDTALDILKAISGVQGFRGGAAAIANVRETLPQLTDSKAVVDQKISNIQTLINNRENALVGQPSGSDQLLIDGANAQNAVNSYVQANPAQADAVANLYQVQGATDLSVYQYLQQSGKLNTPTSTQTSSLGGFSGQGTTGAFGL